MFVAKWRKFAEQENQYTIAVVIDSSRRLAAANLDTDTAMALIAMVSDEPSN